MTNVIALFPKSLPQPVFKPVHRAFSVNVTPSIPNVAYPNDYLNDSLVAFAGVQIARKAKKMFNPMVDIQPWLIRYGIRCRESYMYTFSYLNNPSRKNIMLLLLRSIRGVTFVEYDEECDQVYLTIEKKTSKTLKIASRIIADVIGNAKLATLLIDDPENEIMVA